MPKSAFDISRQGRRARLEAKNVPIIDSYVFAGGNSTPALVSLDVRWEATGPAEELGSGDSVPETDPAHFLGTFAPARATGEFSGIELGFAFQTQSATSDQGYAELGRERNGSFL